MSRNIPRRHTHDAGDIVSGRLRLGLLGTGAPGAGTFLRGDGQWAAAGGGPRGTAEVDFGTFPGGVHASVTITGQSGIGAAATPRAFLRAVDTADHSADEHLIAAGQIDILCTDVTAGVGFTIQAVARWLGATLVQVHGPDRTQRVHPTIGLNTRAAPFGADTVPGPAANMHYGRYALAWEYA
jgi:hypothetical protein